MCEKYKITIFTCVYNRAHTIHRVFESVKNQTYRNLEHIIIDDGSTDNIDELVEEYIETVDIPVKYIKKENGGKHSATNIAWDNSTGDFIIQLDSDDELLPHAIEFLVSEYEKIPDEEKDKYWCVHGRCMDQVQRKLVGDAYPEGINELPVKEAKLIAQNIGGDKIGLMKRDTLEGMRYPLPKHVSFVSESYLWIPLNLRYRTWYTNEVVHIYHMNEGECLSKPKPSEQTFSNRAYFQKYLLENRKAFALKPKKVLRELCKYVICYEFSSEAFKCEYNYFLRNKDFLIEFMLFALRIPGKVLVKLKKLK